MKNKTSDENQVIKHKQLSIKKRKEIAIWANEYGIDSAVKAFQVNLSTVKRWYERFKNNDHFNNNRATPLTPNDHTYLEKFIPMVGKISLIELKRKYSIKYSKETLANYYRDKNILIDNRHMLIYRCDYCQKQIRVINIYFGLPRSITCPHCFRGNLQRKEYYNIPFFNAKPTDYFFNRSVLESANSNIFFENVQPYLKVSNNLHCLFVYAVYPRQKSKIHIIKYFKKIEGNTIPVTFCGTQFTKLNKRLIINPHYQDVKTEHICNSCELPYLRDYNNRGDVFPAINDISPDPLQNALQLFMLAKKYNNRIAYQFMGISKKKFYSIKRKFIKEYNAVNNLVDYG